MNYEVFKPVVGYEDLYEVSNKSTIRSKTRKVVYSDGRVYLYKSKTIKSQVSGTTPFRVYSTLDAAALVSCHSRGTIRNRCLSNNFIGWSVIDA